MFKIKFYGKSVKGKHHEKNEDSFLCNKRKKLFAVCDGVTNPPDGKKASNLAINYLNEFFEENLEEAVYKTNLKIIRDKLSDPKIGYTTLTCVSIRDKLFLAHVGDSSAFLIRNNAISKLTVSHSVGSMLIQTIGMENLKIQTKEMELKSGDFILLCTDGITSVLSEYEILEIVYSKKSLKEIVDNLIEKAENKFQFYNDDKTAILILVL
jgi:serine/threonine protein phosphatase PrpC